MPNEKFLEAYPHYNDIEKLTCILDLAINEEMKCFNYSYYLTTIIIEKKEKSLKYYWFDKDVNSHEVPIGHMEKFDSQKIKQFITAQFKLLKIESIFNNDWTEIGNVHHLFKLNGNEVFLLVVTKQKSFPPSDIWDHLFGVFADNWEYIWDEDELNKILAIPSPNDALKNAFYYWSPIMVACCRVIARGGFDTGYGDPYESTCLFDIISRMASRRYEKRESEGYIVSLSDPDDLIVKFESPVAYANGNPNIFQLRKLLEMTRNGLALAIHEFDFVGLAESSKFEYKIQITGINQWRFCKNDEVLFGVDENKINVSIPVTEVGYCLDADVKKDLFNSETVEKIVGEASKQTHGTTIIFSENAAAEAERLSQYNRCTQIKPLDLVKHDGLVLSLSSIDGALLVDAEGKCHGLGAILDGPAVKPGDSGRGARYNSAVNYVAWKKETEPDCIYCAVIISEDGVITPVTTNTVEKIGNDWY